MTGKYVIGLDFGTKSGRALLVDAKTGEVAAKASMDYAHGVLDEVLPDGRTRLSSGWALQHPGDYIETLEYIVRAVVENAGLGAEDISGVSVDFTACTILPVDASLTPLCYSNRFADRPHAFVKLWKHHAAQEEADEINRLLERRGVLDLPRYGGRISPELMLPKVLQILREDFEVYEAAAQILEAGDWLCQLLTGQKRRSASTASYKAMWYNGEYPVDVFTALDERLSNYAGEKLAGEICPVGGKFGELTDEWAARLGLLPGTAVGCPIIDAHAGMPGCGITEPGVMMLILGTSSVEAILSETPFSGSGIIGAVKDCIIPGYYALETGLAAVGDAFEWFINNAVPEQYRKKAEAAGVNLYHYLGSLTMNYRAGETGLLALDWWAGNKTPFVDAALSGMILGCTPSTKPEHIYRSLVEAAGFGTRMIMDYFTNAGVGINEIRSCGGIAEKDEFLMQIFADITNREIKVSASPETAALGSAVYASTAAGAGRGGHKSVAEAARAMSHLRARIYRPNPGQSGLYSRLYDMYRGLCRYFGGENDVMRQLQKLRSC
ncbi:MAG: ribulokinase [Spirochaetaceae bacterium]|jgi:L-ribulokinase|nr:ribulokinase [Spirochaetaceae bacterium]